MEPDPKLLSLLEKVNNPIEKLDIQLTVKVRDPIFRVYLDFQMNGELRMKVIQGYLPMLLDMLERICLGR
jgi:hypothetical protein